MGATERKAIEDQGGEIGATSSWVSVINSIASQGLKSAVQLRIEGAQFFPSDDELPRDRVCGIDLWSFSPENREAAEYFSRRLYADCVSIIPVLLERPGEKRNHYDSVKAVSDNVIKQECERRAAASFLVVCSRYPYNASSVAEIPSEGFDYVLFPRTVYDRYTQDPSAVPFPSNVRILIVDDTIKRFVSVKNYMKLEIPNYEQALLEILNSGKLDIFVHGARLPLSDEKILFRKIK